MRLDAGKVTEHRQLADTQIRIVEISQDESGEVYLVDFAGGGLTKEWSIQFSRPLRNKAGTFQGVVVASYRLSHFIDLYEKLKISDRGLAALAGKDGVVRIRSLSGSIGYGASVSKMAVAYDRVMAG